VSCELRRYDPTSTAPAGTRSVWDSWRSCSMFSILRRLLYQSVLVDNSEETFWRSRTFVVQPTTRVWRSLASAPVNVTSPSLYIVADLKVCGTLYYPLPDDGRTERSAGPRRGSGLGRSAVIPTSMWSGRDTHTVAGRRLSLCWKHFAVIFCRPLRRCLECLRHNLALVHAEQCHIAGTNATLWWSLFATQAVRTV